MESETNLATNLAEAIQGFAAALDEMSKALKECRQSGMQDIEIRDAIMEQIPEADRPAFMQQWPMISMMFAML